MSYVGTNDYELLYLIEENNQEANEYIFKKYKPLVDKHIFSMLNIAKKAGLEYDDLYQEAMIAIDYAIKNYKNDGNTLFYTYVNICIKGKIYNVIRSNTNNKHRLLNESLSFETQVTESSTIEEFIEDDYILTDEILRKDLENNIIFFKHELLFEHSLIFELRTNGFSTKEISLLLNFSEKKINNVWLKCKNKLKEYILKNVCMQ